MTKPVSCYFSLAMACAVLEDYINAKHTNCVQTHIKLLYYSRHTSLSSFACLHNQFTCIVVNI